MLMYLNNALLKSQVVFVNEQWTNMNKWTTIFIN